MRCNNILMAFLAIIVASCSKESMVYDNIPELSKEEVLVTAGIGNRTNDSRVVFETIHWDSVTHVSWVVEDVITLYPESQDYLHYMAVNYQDSKAAPTHFESTQEEVLRNVEGQVVYACYPDRKSVV